MQDHAVFPTRIVRGVRFCSRVMFTFRWSHQCAIGQYQIQTAEWVWFNDWGTKSELTITNCIWTWTQWQNNDSRGWEQNNFSSSFHKLCITLAVTGRPWIVKHGVFLFSFFFPFLPKANKYLCPNQHGVQMFIDNKRFICLRQRIFFRKKNVVMTHKFDLWSINDRCFEEAVPSVTAISEYLL